MSLIKHLNKPIFTQKTNNMSTDNKEFTGEKLKELRKEYQMTQVELSKETGIARTKLSEYENGAKMSKSISILLKLFFEKKKGFF